MRTVARGSNDDAFCGCVIAHRFGVAAFSSQHQGKLEPGCSRCT
jgi:hypothetical protein